MNLNRFLVQSIRPLLKKGSSGYGRVSLGGQRLCRGYLQAYSSSAFIDSESFKDDKKRAAFREAISLNGYNVVRPLGYGAFGHVTLCTGASLGERKH